MVTPTSSANAPPLKQLCQMLAAGSGRITDAMGRTSTASRTAGPLPRSGCLRSRRTPIAVRERAISTRVSGTIATARGSLPIAGRGRHDDVERLPRSTRRAASTPPTTRGQHGGRRCSYCVDNAARGAQVAIDEMPVIDSPPCLAIGCLGAFSRRSAILLLQWLAHVVHVEPEDALGELRPLGTFVGFAYGGRVERLLRQRCRHHRPRRRRPRRRHRPE